MKIIRSSDLLEKSLAFVFILIFLVFAIFFTVSNENETKHSFNARRIELTKSLAHEIIDLLDRRIDITSKLSNVLAENSIAYAVVQLGDGSILARSEGYALPVGIFETAEAEAMKAQFLIMTPFKEPSGRTSLVEAAMPLYGRERVKYILRIGFFRNTEEIEISHIRFRNILVFALIFVFFGSVWSVKYLAHSSIRYALVGSSTLVMLVLFFAGAYILRQWYGPFWRNNFVENECISMTRMLMPSAIKLIEGNSQEEFEKSVKLLAENKDFAMAAAIKDDAYIFHTDFNRIGSSVDDENYRKSLNSDKPSVFKRSNAEIFQVMFPVLSGTSRIGTVCTTWNCEDGIKAIAPLRDKLTMLFVFAYLALYWFMHIYSDEIYKRITRLSRSKDTRIKTGEESAITEAASAEKPKEDNKQLAVSVFVYFSGISEAVQKIDSVKISESIKQCFDLAKEQIKTKKNCSIRLQTNGIFTLFYGKNEQDSLVEAVEFARNLNNGLTAEKSLYFLPKITMHASRLILVKPNIEAAEPWMAGDCLVDYKTIARIQDNNQIIVSAEARDLLENIIKFETFEIISPECGKFNVYALGDYKDAQELSNSFESSNDWTKLMILRILKNDDDFNGSKLDDWAKDASPVVKEELLQLIESKNSVRS